MLKLLALCDSPTAETGFARVARNLLLRWHRANGGPFDEINIWAINYRGEKHSLPFWIFNGGNGANWAAPENLAQFLRTLKPEPGQQPYTHCWILQDTFMLSQHKFPEGLALICKRYGIRAAYYFPVDAPLEPEWTGIIQSVAAAVAYTEYGKREALKVLPKNFNPSSLRVLPHGCDGKIYRPIADRPAIREKLFKPGEGQKEFIGLKDFLIVNVNANQRRKDIPRSLRILRELKEKAQHSNNQFRMLLHMPRQSSDGVNLSKVGAQLGLKENEDWMCSDQYFQYGFAQLAEQHVAEIYTAADLMLTTTLGEGWGFCLTEALGCGCPIAAPNHTACAEVMDRLVSMECPTPIIPLKAVNFDVVNAFDNSRYRQCVNVDYAVETIFQFASTPRPGPRLPLPKAAAEWMSWDRIAKEWEKILMGEPADKNQIRVEVQ